MKILKMLNGENLEFSSIKKTNAYLKENGYELAYTCTIKLIDEDFKEIHYDVPEKFKGYYGLRHYKGCKLSMIGGYRHADSYFGYPFWVKII